MDIGWQVGGRQVGTWQMQRNRETVDRSAVVSEHRWTGRRLTGRQLADTKEKKDR